MMPEQVWNEKPRCEKCGHRRIHHFRGIAGHAGKGVTTEIMVRCTMPRCGCPDYTPVDAEPLGAMVSTADLATRDNPPYG